MNETARPFYVTEPDRLALRRLFSTRKPAHADVKALASLWEKLERTTVIHPADVPAEAVTLNSRVRVRDLDTGMVGEYALVLPVHADISEGKVSVLAPVGVALLGQQQGDEVEWNVPAGRKRFVIEAVLYQPEASAAETARAAA